AHGSFPIRNHYAGFLELSLTLCAGLAAAALSRGARNGLPMTSALQASAGFFGTVAILGGLFYSLSRMGWFSGLGALCSMALWAATEKLQGWKRWPALGLLCATVVAAFLWLAPIPLVERFAQISADERAPAWLDTLHLFPAYPLFGCGLG